MRSREQLYANIIEALPEHIAVLDREGQILLTNRAWNLFARDNGAGGSLSVSVGANYLEVCQRAAMENDPLAQEAIDGIRAVIAGQCPLFTLNYPCHGPAEQRWFSMKVAALNGEDRGAIVTHLNITQQVQAEAAVKDKERRLRQAMYAARAGSWTINATSGEVVIRPQARQLLGLASDIAVTQDSITEHANNEDRRAVQAVLQESIRSGSPTHVEFRNEAPHEPVRWLACHAERIEEDGQVIVAGLVQDITEQKSREEQIRILVREVNHRSKNLLSLVQAVAQQTARSSPDYFLPRFEERLHALARSHDLLVGTEWRAVPIEDLAHSELGHFTDLIGTRITLLGPTLLLRAQATQALGMALHELATNAAKYGALSCDTGKVEIAWQITPRGDARSFSMTWTESLGPDVVEPARRGFGSYVISDMLEMGLTASVEIEHARTGLRWRLTCAASSVLED